MYNIRKQFKQGDLFAMAKKKDITRNPPSWLEKGLFIVVILIMVGIAFPMYWKLNEHTREFYDCAEFQKVLLECVDEWREATGASAIKNPTEEELLAIYKEKTGESAFPVCPHGGESIVKVNKKGGANVGCTEHPYDPVLGEIQDDD